MFLAGKDSIPEWNDWSNCLVPAQRFVSNETYFYAYKQGPVLFDVQQDTILSYHSYLEEVDAEELLLV